jgi:hypothetical protein
MAFAKGADYLYIILVEGMTSGIGRAIYEHYSRITTLLNCT